jgi:hypothetical protein
VTWNWEAGHVSGKIIKVHTKDVDYKGHTHHASEDDPQYEIKSSKTDHIAMQKGSALKKQHDSPLSGGQLASAHHSRREWRLALACGVSAAPPVQTEADFLPPQPVFRYTVDSDGRARRTQDRPARGAPGRQLFHLPLKSGLASPLLHKR